MGSMWKPNRWTDRTVGLVGVGVATGAVVDAATELRDQGTYGYASATAAGIKAARQAFK